MKRTLLLASLFTIGCSKDPLSSVQTGNPYFKVEFLFEHDGCKVYRFMDMNWRYFTKCKGSVEWEENCGKNCVRQMSVDGGKNE